MALESTTRSRVFFNSSIGLKTVMAVTGIVLISFVIAHLLGNLQIFLGPEKFNAYADFLKSFGGLLWGARIGLIIVFVLHITSGLRLRQMNAAARPISYAVQRHVKTSLPSAFMVETGLLILAFVLFHLAHFTLGWVEPTHFELEDAKGRHDVYAMVVFGFQNIFYSGAYIFFMVMLGLHLHHGIASVFQTLGLNHSRCSAAVQRAAPLIAWVLALGYIAIPVAVLLGFVR